MKKLIIGHLVLLTSIGAFSAKKADWDNVNVLQINREKPHTTMMVYGSEQAALSFDKRQSVYHQCLNGLWKFH
ncbi:MAG: hypothetical protein MI866_13980 [Bacteroidales bacterium]|nr:hypothetical protein [Bacteroidales bacterium]